VPLIGYEGTVKTAVEGTAFCLEWGDKGQPGVFPEYYKQAGDKRIAIAASEVPAETKLTAQSFTPAGAGEPYTSPASGCWITPGPSSRGPFKAVLTDGSIVTYSWYRFVDQPALQNLGLTDAQKSRLQHFVEQLHAKWKTTSPYIPASSSGALASLDSALLVKPPVGLGVGYVPIVTRQGR
jgi:hypothetical protein